MSGDSTRPGAPEVLRGFGPVLIGSLALLTIMRLGDVDVFLTSDAGHYLADADALGGSGVRDLRHLPLFPAVIRGLDLVLSDRTTIDAAAVVLVLALFASLWYLLHDRVHRIAALVGATVAAASPLTGEGVAWFGGAMLLGLAAAFLTMRLIDDALATGRRWRTLAAAVGIIATLSTHLIPSMLVAVVAAVSVVQHGVGEHGRGRLRTRVPVLLTCSAAALGTAIVNRRFYFDVEQPLVVDVDLNRLKLLWEWAFRDLWVFWLALVVVGLAVVFLKTSSAGQRRLGGWAVATTTVALGSTVAFGGDPSYTTRGLYALVLPAALGAAWIADRALNAGTERMTRLSGSLATIVVATILGASLWTYQSRLSIAVPYYNRVDAAELEAIEYLAGESPDTVVVAAKAANRDAGTLYSWMVEGLAEARAIGPGRQYLFLLDRARIDSLAAERFLAGARTIEIGSTRVGLDDDQNTAAVSVRVDGEWIPVLRLDTVAGDRNDPAPSGDVDVESDGRGGVVVRINLPVGRTSGEIRPTPYLPVGLSAAQPDQFKVPAPGGTVSVTVESSSLAPTIVTDPVTGGAVVALVRSGTSATSLSITVSGGDALGSERATYFDTDLIATQRITHVLSWNHSADASDLADRNCLTRAFANDEMTAWRVRSECRR